MNKQLIEQVDGSGTTEMAIIIPRQDKNWFEQIMATPQTNRNSYKFY